MSPFLQVRELREALSPDDSTSQHGLSRAADLAVRPPSSRFAHSCTLDPDSSQHPQASLGTGTAPLVWLTPHTPHDPPPDDAPSRSLGRPGPRSVFFPASRTVQY